MTKIVKRDNFMLGGGEEERRRWRKRLVDDIDGGSDCVVQVKVW